MRVPEIFVDRDCVFAWLLYAMYRSLLNRVPDGPDNRDDNARYLKESDRFSGNTRKYGMTYSPKYGTRAVSLHKLERVY